MKEIIDGTTYNTDTSTLVKAMVIVEDLTNGYTRYRTIQLWYGNRVDEWFVSINKTTVDRKFDVIDICESIYPVNDEFVYRFDKEAPAIM